MRYRGFELTATPTRGTERVQTRSSGKELCKGFFCEVYDPRDMEQVNMLDFFSGSMSEKNEKRRRFSVCFLGFAAIFIYAVYGFSDYSSECFSGGNSFHPCLDLVWRSHCRLQPFRAAFLPESLSFHQKDARYPEV